jgi:hypothetical protein
VILKINSCKAILNKKNACTNKLAGKYPAPVFGGKKMLQNSMVAGIDLTSPRR